jgi:hypothetical protein
MQASSVAADATEARLTDALFAVKNAVEDRDIPRLRRLFADRPQISIQGRFLTLAEFLKRMEELFTRVDHISMDIARIEEVDEKVDGGLIAARVDFGWIDSKLWEEQQMHGLLTLTLARAQPQRTRQKAGTAAQARSAARDEKSGQVTGFSYQALPRDGEGGDGDGDGDGKGRPPGGGGVGPRPGPSAGRGGYGFWF